MGGVGGSCRVSLVEDLVFLFVFLQSPATEEHKHLTTTTHPPPSYAPYVHSAGKSGTNPFFCSYERI